MKKKPTYMDCFCEVVPIKNINNHEIELVEIKVPFTNTSIIENWAISFRSKYINNDDLRDMTEATGIGSLFEYLIHYVYPDKDDQQGKIVRIGDFGEILVADYLMFVRDYWIPSLLTRYSSKQNKDRSTMGADIFAIKFVDNMTSDNPEDELCICEVKTGFSKKARYRLKDAVDDINKDNVAELDKRASISLAATMIALKKRNDIEANFIDKIRRFQNPVEKPFKTSYLAAAVIDETQLREKNLMDVKTDSSPHREQLGLITFHGENLKQLMNILYGELGVKNIGDK
ncbi:Hachiman antiphage defense system protein HamA [Liquorilactobacillus nagelii]|uniref:Hachiman antiphage defense system protein HamA n=1 Tax=Liquorilactobacillus nagelii TaxID=82688 RepID=UPI0039E8D64A